MSPSPDDAPGPAPPARPRPQARQFVALIVIGSATAMALGEALRAPTFIGANDISRWCTVWSLLERGTYAIDDCPWSWRTIDKVRKRAPFQAVREGEEPIEHFYSSKPPLLPSLIAAILYPVRRATGVPLDRTREEPRAPRYVQKEGGGPPVLETPESPVKWAVSVLYFKPIVLLLNLVPMVVALVLYARMLDRLAENDWAWMLALFAAAWGTYLLAFDATLNNHTVAAYSAFFAIYALARIWEEPDPGPLPFATAGVFGAFCACNELPAALFGLLLFVGLLARSPRRTLLIFVPAAAVPCVAYLATQYVAMGQFRPAYEEFGTRTYNYEGSYWNTPLEFDLLNKEPEPKALYLFHMTFGHHGIFSLTPIFLFSAYGIARAVRGRARGIAVLGGMTAVLTVAMLAFYTWNPKARNYGGSTQGLRWLFWLIPFWLAMLPVGLGPAQDRPWLRRLSLAALCVSMASVGYAFGAPWSHPWFLDAIEHLGLYHLQR